MTDDDERMDRARRIREMREGSRPQDEGSSDDQQTDETANDANTGSATDESATTDGGEQPGTGTDGETDSSDSTTTGATAAESDDTAAAESDDTAAEQTDVSAAEAGDDTAAEATDAAAEETDDGGTIHIPGAEVGDVNVDVEEMAQEAGLQSAGGDAGGGTEEDPAEPAATGAVGRAEEVQTDAAEETRVLEFTLGTEQYCLDIEYVEEIVKQESVTRVPNTPECVEGVVDLRGQITTILDPKVLLDIPDEGSKDLIVVFDPEEFDDQGAVGWVVDDVNQVTPITEDEVNPSPVDQDHVNGVVDRDGEFVIWTTPELDLDEVAG